MRALKALFCAIAAVVVAGQSSITVSYYVPGTKCSEKRTDMRDSYMSAGSCLPFDNHPEECHGKSTCGAIYTCNATTVTISYWYYAGDVCTRNPPELVAYYATETCLPPSNGYYNNNTDSVFHCQL
jgi:hypothetical protein